MKLAAGNSRDISGQERGSLAKTTQRNYYTKKFAQLLPTPCLA